MNINIDTTGIYDVSALMSGPKNKPNSNPILGQYQGSNPIFRQAKNGDFAWVGALR
jgi:hypothetical protein